MTTTGEEVTGTSDQEYNVIWFTEAVVFRGMWHLLVTVFGTTLGTLAVRHGV